MTEPTNQPADVTTFWEQVSALVSGGNGLPSREQFVEFVTSMGFFQAVVQVALGAVYLLYGWKVFKALVIVNATLGGAILGSMLGARMDGQNMQIIASVTGGAMFGIVAWPMMKYAVAVMGGLADGDVSVLIRGEARASVLLFPWTFEFETDLFRP